MRPRFLLRDAADINRLVVHLVTHWKRPAVDVRIDQLPTLESHRAQDQLARLTEACNCIVGEALGGVTLLIGCCLACIWQGWRYLLWTLVATLAAVLVGKGVEVAWNRVSLLLLLRRLRHRVSDAIAGRLVESTPVKVAETRTYDYPLNSLDGDVPQHSRIQHRHSLGGPDRPRLLLRDASDVDRALRHLFAHWKVPRIVIQIDEIPARSLERAQDRLVRLSAGYSYQLAGVLAFATFVVSMTYVMRPPKDILLWTLDQDWGDFLMVLMVTFLAALLGSAGEILWIRMRLLRVLRSLRRQLPGS
ncbi:MAG TPA: hypothetical protein VMK82_07185 [Steroidobacteraceae bacterium]|nr:hypothetical protein [Steroidobacteraceae bacterium]